MPDERIYRISFMQQGQVYEMYARAITQGALFGFVEVDGVLFGERSKLLVDSSEEKLKTEFDGVQRFHVPIHSVIRIDEVEKAGSGRIMAGESGGRVTPIPFPMFGPAREPGK